ncbi:hypothetical protein HDU80_011359, partial [Chytriomyces hyalinus]
HYTFETYARHLLYAYLTDANDEQLRMSPPSNLKPQLVGYLGGEAGTGKSAVIAALLLFSRLWGRPNTIETMAFMGLAGLMIDGDTIHSKRGLGIDLARSKPLSHPLKQKILPVILSIVDEVSMTKIDVMGAAEQRTREAFPLGDDRRTKLEVWLCRELWNNLNWVAFLTKVWRQKDDPHFLSMLSQMRWGQLTRRDIVDINKYTASSMQGNPPAKPDIGQDFFAPVATAMNTERCAIIRKCIVDTCRELDLPCYRIFATPTNKDNMGDIMNIHYLNDDATSKIPLKFDFYIGMPIMITKRIPELEHLKVKG